MASPNTTRNEDKDSADLYSTPTVALDAIKPYLPDLLLLVGRAFL